MIVNIIALLIALSLASTAAIPRRTAIVQPQHRESKYLYKTFDLEKLQKINDLARSEERYQYLAGNLTEYYEYRYAESESGGTKLHQDILVISPNIFLMFNGEIVQVNERNSIHKEDVDLLKSSDFESCKTVSQKHNHFVWFWKIVEYLFPKTRKRNLAVEYRNKYYNFKSLNPCSKYELFLEFDIISIKKIPRRHLFGCRENNIENRVVYLFQEFQYDNQLKTEDTIEGVYYLKEFLELNKKIDEKLTLEVSEPLGAFCEVPYKDTAHIELTAVDYEIKYKKRNSIKPKNIAKGNVVFESLFSDIKTAVFPGKGEMKCVFQSSCPGGYKQGHYDMENLNQDFRRQNGA